MNLVETWIELTSKLNVHHTLQETLWSEIVTAYQQPQRFYHNLNHILDLVTLAKHYQGDIDDFDSLLFSLFYHDITYQVKQNNNEIESAKLAANRLSLLNYPEDKISKCYRQIIATQDHRLSQESDTNYLLDLDLSILGGERSKYREYSQNIRQEYGMYSEEVYNQGRSEFLERLLNRYFLYKTKLFRDSYEQRARENLSWELERLKSDF